MNNDVICAALLLALELADGELIEDPDGIEQAQDDVFFIESVLFFYVNSQTSDAADAAKLRGQSS